MFVSVAASRRLLSTAAVVAVLAAPSQLAAQSAAEHLALGDRAHAAMNATTALRHYEDAIKADPKSYDALCKASSEAVELGETTTNPAERERLYRLAEQYARRAVEANPGDAQGHFELSRGLGRMALSLGKKDQVKYAGEVRVHALEALKRSPRHAGALHVMGMWNYNVMKLSGVTRFMAKKFLGGKVFDAANWADAQRYMEESVAVEPNRLVHRLDLGKVYAARGDKERARAAYEAAMRATPTDLNDGRYQAEAAEELKALR